MASQSDLALLPNMLRGNPIPLLNRASIHLISESSAKMKTTQSQQRAAQHLLATLTPAHLAPEKPFAYVVNRTNDDNPMRGAPSRIAFIADSVDFVGKVIDAMRTLNYETGFAVFVNGRAFEIVGRMPVTV